MVRSAVLVLLMFGVAGCSAPGPESGAEPGPGSAAQADGSGPSPATSVGLPAGEADAVARLAASPRHGEWVAVQVSPGDSIRAWVVYPERSTPAPVVIVVHEIFGLSHWVRAVADQLAADGFIAIAPDLMTRQDLPTGSDGAPNADAARSAIQGLDRDQVHRDILAAAEYGMSLPAAQRRYGIVGYCWGGTVSFEHAIRSPALGASVVFYGSSPDTALMASISAPVLGLYGGNDARVNATIPAAEEAMRRLGLRYEHEIYPGAGHGFLRAQQGQDGANLNATRAAWPRAIDWFRQHLEG